MKAILCLVVVTNVDSTFTLFFNYYEYLIINFVRKHQQLAFTIIITFLLYLHSSTVKNLSNEHTKDMSFPTSYLHLGNLLS